MLRGGLRPTAKVLGRRITDVQESPLMSKFFPALIAFLAIVAVPIIAAPHAAAQQANPFTQKDLEKAAAAFQARPDLMAASQCITGNGRACTEFGLMHQNGIAPVPKDEAKAMANFIRACDLRDAAGCRHMGAALHAGRGAPIDLVKARFAYIRACTSDDGPGCAEAGRMLLRGQGGPVQVEDALTLLGHGCNLKTAGACAALGFHFGGQPPSDTAKAASYFGRACDLGERMLCAERDRLASLAAPAPRITVADVAAASARGALRPELRLQAGCAARNAAACTEMGVMLMNGAPNLAKDEAAAATHFRLACDLNHGQGCRALGMALQAGRGGAINLPQAQAAYAKACTANDAQGCGRAGNLYLTGQGVPKDVPQGLSLLTRGCDQRDAMSCNTLGLHYGTVAPQDIAKAALSFGKACNLGVATACSNRDRITRVAPR